MIGSLSSKHTDLLTNVKQFQIDKVEKIKCVYIVGGMEYDTKKNKKIPVNIIQSREEQRIKISPSEIIYFNRCIP